MSVPLKRPTYRASLYWTIVAISIIAVPIVLVACLRHTAATQRSGGDQAQQSIAHQVQTNILTVAPPPPLPSRTPQLFLINIPASVTPTASHPITATRTTTVTRRVVVRLSTPTPSAPTASTRAVLSPLALPTATSTSAVVDQLTELLTNMVPTTGSLDITLTATQSITVFMPVIEVPVTTTISITRQITDTPRVTDTQAATGTVAVADATATAAPDDLSGTDAITPTVTTDTDRAEAGIVETETATSTPVAAVHTLEPIVIPQPTPDGVARTVRIPILMYHYLSIPPAGADIYRQDLSVSPELFAAHLDAMRGAGYTAISLYALVDHLARGAALPEKPVILTFDDGYRDQYENALPILVAHGMTATFFVVTDFIDAERPEYVTWDMVREMYAAGMSIESHGRNHASLRNRDGDFLVWQALGSLETIEYELGVRPRFVSYPAGEYDQQTIDIFRSANYWAGATTQQGATHSNDNLFELRRVRVRGTTEPQELLRLLALDW